ADEREPPSYPRDPRSAALAAGSRSVRKLAGLSVCAPAAERLSMEPEGFQPALSVIPDDRCRRAVVWTSHHDIQVTPRPAPSPTGLPLFRYPGRVSACGTFCWRPLPCKPGSGAPRPLPLVSGRGAGTAARAARAVVYPNPADNSISAKTSKTAMNSTSSFAMALGNALARFPCGQKIAIPCCDCMW